MQIAFYRGSGPGAWLVRKFTRSAYGHCAVLNSRTLLTEATCTGVIRRVWGNGPADQSATLVDVPGDRAIKGMVFLNAQLGKPYDWPAIVLDVVAAYVKLPRFITDETRRRWTCSRLAAFAAAESGWEGPAWTVPATPGGLYDALTQTTTAGDTP